MFGSFLKAVGLDSFLNMTQNDESKEEGEDDDYDSQPNRYATFLNRFGIVYLLSSSLIFSYFSISSHKD